MEPNQELEELRDLVMSPGWLRFVERVNARYNDAMLGQRALYWLSGGADLNAKVAQEKAINDAVHELADWPRKRIAVLERS